MEPHIHENLIDWQFLFNIAVGLVGILLGFLMNRIFLALDELREQDEKLTEEITQIKISLPTNYATKEDVETIGHAIFRRLDSIDQKLYEIRGENHDTQSK